MLFDVMIFDTKNKIWSNETKSQITIFYFQIILELRLVGNKLKEPKMQAVEMNWRSFTGHQN